MNPQIEGTKHKTTQNKGKEYMILNKCQRFFQWFLGGPTWAVDRFSLKDVISQSIIQCMFRSLSSSDFRTQKKNTLEKQGDYQKKPSYPTECPQFGSLNFPNPTTIVFFGEVPYFFSWSKWTSMEKNDENTWRILACCVWPGLPSTGKSARRTPKMLVGFAVISFQCHLFHVMFWVNEMVSFHDAICFSKKDLEKWLDLNGFLALKSQAHQFSRRLAYFLQITITSRNAGSSRIPSPYAPWDWNNYVPTWKP